MIFIYLPGCKSNISMGLTNKKYHNTQHFVRRSVIYLRIETEV